MQLFKIKIFCFRKIKVDFFKIFNIFSLAHFLSIKAYFFIFRIADTLKNLKKLKAIGPLKIKKTQPHQKLISR